MPLGQICCYVLRLFPFLSLVGYVGLLGGASCLWEEGEHDTRGGSTRVHGTNHPSISYWPGIWGANTEWRGASSPLRVCAEPRGGEKALVRSLWGGMRDLEELITDLTRKTSLLAERAMSYEWVLASLRSRSTVARLLTGLRAGKPVEQPFESWQRQNIYFFSTASSLVLRHILSLIKSVTAAGTWS